MNEQVPDENPSRGRAKPGRTTLQKVGLGVVIGGAVVAVGTTAAYLNRRALADEILVGWLHKRGIQADVEVQRFDWDGFTGRIIVGDPNNPDVRIERVDVDYAIGMPWSKAGAGVTPSRVVLSRPLIKAQWLDNSLSLGSLDPLIKELSAKPPSPDKRGPLIIVEKGEARVMTEYGLVTLRADATIDNGRLKALDANIPVSALDHTRLGAQGLTGTLKASEDKGALKFTGQFAAQSLRLEQVNGEAIDLTFAGSVPYPPSGANKAVGDVILEASLDAGRLQTPDVMARQARLNLDWRGQINGWFNDFVLTGQLVPNLQAGQFKAFDQQLTQAVIEGQRLDVELSQGQNPAHGDNLFWKVQGPLSIKAQEGQTGDFRARGLTLSSGNLLAGGWGKVFEVQGPLRLAAAQLDGQDLTLRDVSGQMLLDVVGDAALKLSAHGSIMSRNSAYRGMGPITGEDAPQIAQIKTALQSFDLDAPDVRFVMGDSHSELSLGRAITLKPKSGGQVVLDQGGRPLMQMAQGQAGGSAALISTGGGLPELDLKMTQWRSQSGGLVADVQGRAQLDFATAKGIDLNTRGRLSIAQGVTRYQTTECADIGVTQLEMGENTLDAISGRLCATQGPLFQMAQGRWSLQGRLDKTQLAATFLDVSMQEAAGPLVVRGDARGLMVDLGVEAARLEDTAKETRFNPLAGTGRLSLASDIWSGQFDLKSSGQSVAALCLAHNGKTAQGGMGIVTAGMGCLTPAHAQAELATPTGGLYFAKDGLQPKTISPVAGSIFGEEAAGRAAFAGQMFWDAEGVQSAGRLVLDGLSFSTPIGTLRGGTGNILMTSLTPLAIPSNQTVHFDSVDGPLPMRDGRVTLGFADNAVYLQHASVQLAKGAIYLYDSARYGPFSASALPPRDAADKGMQIPLNETQSWQFGVALDQIQLNDLVVAMGGKEKASLDAVVSGVLPVTFKPEWGFAVSNGILVANRRGSLSIAPEVLGNVETGTGQVTSSEGEEAKVPRNMMQDLAYQALEHLTFTDLRADVNSVCLPKNDVRRASSGLIDISNSGGEFCHNLETAEGGVSNWVPSRLALDFAINGYYDPPERREMRLSLIDVLRGNFMNKKMILPSDTPVTLGLKVSLNAYDMASQLMDYVRMRNSDAENP